MMATLTLTDLPSDAQLTAAARVQELLGIQSGPALAVVAAVLDGLAAATLPADPLTLVDGDDVDDLRRLVEELEVAVIAAERCGMPEKAEELRRQRHALAQILDHTRTEVPA